MSRTAPRSVYDTSADDEQLRRAFTNGELPVAIYGLGKMGLPLAGVYADVTGATIGVDIDQQVVDQINAGESPIQREPGLPELVERVVADGSLDAAVSLRTFHHGVRDALPSIVDALRPGGRLVVLDWSTSAPDFEAGPPESERYDVAGIARAMIDAGCRIVRTEQRRETDLVIGERRV